MPLLVQYDVFFYHLVNQVMVCSVLDWFMPFVTNVHHWIPVYVLALALLAWKGGIHGRRCTVILLIGVLISDPLNSRVIKELVQRPRPSVTLATARVLTPAGGASFPSSHATNNFAAALVLSAYYPKRRWLWYSAAFVVAYSRVYVGVHYPLDVLGGAVEGTLLAWLLLILDSRLFPQWRSATSSAANEILE